MPRDLPQPPAAPAVQKVQRFRDCGRHVFHVDADGRLAQVGPRGDVETESGHVHALQFNVRRNLHDLRVQRGAVQLDILDLALAIEQVGVDLFFAKANNELRVTEQRYIHTYILCSEQ